MPFKLFQCIIHRSDYSARAFVVAPTEDAAILAIVEHDQQLGMKHRELSITRIDNEIDEELLPGLEELLANAPVGFASFADRWIAHIAPVQQLKFYRVIDDNGANIFAVAPNADIAAVLFTKELRVKPGEKKLMHISDGMVDLPESMVGDLPRLLEFGPIGIALFELDERRWFVV